MSAIVKCTGGEGRAQVRVELWNRVEVFDTLTPPIEIEPKELETPTRGRRSVNTHTTSPNYGDEGLWLVTLEIFLPIRRVFGQVGQLAGTDRTRWYVEDALGNVSQLLSTVPGNNGGQWGTPVRYSIGPLISGSDPVTSYALEVRDSGGNERIWTAPDAPIPWQHFCGCKPNELQCGAFPFDFCCLPCASLISSVNSIEGGIDGAIAQVDALIQKIEQHRL
ncbi:MAG: hypothetical protein AAGF75_01025 [Cyanobacteria bacterium P01_H01_bin.130]